MGDLASWQVWMVALKSAFGELLTIPELAAFHRIAGDRPPPRKRVRELWAIAGRRSGKSRMAAACGVSLALFEEHRLAPGEIGHIPIIACSKDQAKTVWNYVLGFLEASDLLAAEIESRTANEIRLRGNIVISVHAGSFRTVRGRTLLACVVDEVAFLRDELSATPDVELIRAVTPSLLASNGMLIGISTGYRKAGVLFTRYRDYFAQDDPDVLVISGTARDFNPTLNQALIDKAYRDDPEAAAAEWGGEFRSDIGSYLDDATIAAAIDHDRPL